MRIDNLDHRVSGVRRIRSMSDDPTKRGTSDRSRINVNEEYEVQYWTEKWGVSGESLKAAVEKVGPSVADVAKELGKET